MVVLAIHHIQLAMPEGGEVAARGFFPLLGFEEIPKPEMLAARGGVWFRKNGVELHLGVERDFRPAHKAHPAFRVAKLEAVCDRLAMAGVETQRDGNLPGYVRAYVDDPFGNRIELLEPLDGGS